MPTNREIFFNLLNEKNKYLSRLVIKSILNDVNGFNNDIDLYKNFDLEVKNISKLSNMIERIKSGEPYQYVLGYANFIDLLFIVNPKVLIPRQETEDLVIKTKTLIESMFPYEEILTIGDVATGSGGIGISLKKYFPKYTVFASDIDSNCLDIADKNSKKFGLEVNCLLGNMLDPFIENKILLDVLICNPPYIEDISSIDPQVLQYEPHLALLANPCTKFYEDIFKNVEKVMKTKSLLAFEIGENMVDCLDELVCRYLPYASYYFLKDIYQKYRFLFIILNGDGQNA